MSGVYHMPQYDWTNAHHNVSFTVPHYYDVWNRGETGPVSANPYDNWKNGLANLKSILAEAEKTDSPVRAAGSRWSLSQVLCSKGFLVNTQPLDIAFIGLPKSFAPAEDKPGRLVVTQCGTNINQLNRWLFDKNLALRTCGASDGQTFAGAMSTGTHGGAIKLGSVQDYVLGIHILTSSTESVWLEGSTPILTDEAVEKFCGEGVRRENDNTILRAALVSFGSFGIIHSILFRADPLYKLELYQDYFPLDVIKRCLANPKDLSPLGWKKPNPDHVEFIVNPYKTGSVVARVMYKVDMESFIGKPILDLGIDLIEVLGEIADIMPKAVPGIMRLIDKQFKERYPKVSGDLRYPGNIFTGDQSGFRGKGVSMEIGVPQADSTKALDIVLDVARTEVLPGAIGIRYIAKSEALLSMAKFDPTCTIEIQAAFSDRARTYYNVLWKRLEAEHIPYTFHWGQMNNLDEEKVKDKWGPGAVKKWIESRHAILKNKDERDRFANDFLITCGLNQ